MGSTLTGLVDLFNITEAPCSSTSKHINTIKSESRKRKLGQAYIGYKAVAGGKKLRLARPAKERKGRCEGHSWRRGFMCSKFSDSELETLFSRYWAMDDSQKSVFINKYAKQKEDYQEARGTVLRFMEYSLPRQDKVLSVCAILFLNTLAVSKPYVLGRIQHVCEGPKLKNKISQNRIDESLKKIIDVRRFH